jgi:hypothetical protein
MFFKTFHGGWSKKQMPDGTTQRSKRLRNAELVTEQNRRRQVWLATTYEPPRV